VASLPIVAGYRRLAPSGQAEGMQSVGFLPISFFSGLPPGRRGEANRFSRPAVKKIGREKPPVVALWLSGFWGFDCQVARATATWHPWGRTGDRALGAFCQSPFPRAYHRGKGVRQNRLLGRRLTNRPGKKLM